MKIIKTSLLIIVLASSPLIKAGEKTRLTGGNPRAYGTMANSPTPYQRLINIQEEATALQDLEATIDELEREENLAEDLSNATSLLEKDIKTIQSQVRKPRTFRDKTLNTMQNLAQNLTDLLTAEKIQQIKEHQRLEGVRSLLADFRAKNAAIHRLLVETKGFFGRCSASEEALINKEIINLANIQRDINTHMDYAYETSRKQQAALSSLKDELNQLNGDSKWGVRQLNTIDPETVRNIEECTTNPLLSEEEQTIARDLLDYIKNNFDFFHDYLFAPDAYNTDSWTRKTAQ